MSENNQIPEHDDIEELLKAYQKQRSEKKEKKETAFDDSLPPPIRREDIIDFSKNVDEAQEEEQEKTSSFDKFKKSLKDFARFVRKVAVKAKTIIFNKITLIVIIVIAVIIGGGFAVKAIIDSSKSAYLKPYEQKYNVEFPVGILEKYCDYYGEDQRTVAYLEIKGTDIKTPVYEKSAKKYPACEDLAVNAEQGNFVVYTDDKNLESIYSTADGYNNADAEIFYSDLFNEYNFRIIGAFYTNSTPDDDNGYIFPYNTSEKMTADSANDLSDRVSSRLLYNTGLTITGHDRMIFISCPADYRENFRFVLVGIQRDDLSNKLQAKEKREDEIHFPQVIYDESERENRYRFSKQWYPEYEITNPETDKVTTVKTDINDYKSRTPDFTTED